MFHVKNHKQAHIFDPWDHLGPKRRKLLDQSWAGLFQQEILLRKQGQGKMEKTIHSTAYQKLRQWLVAQCAMRKKLTQRQLAALLDVSYSWIGKVELGERRLDIVEFVRLCGALEVNPHAGLELVIRQVEKDKEQ